METSIGNIPRKYQVNTNAEGDRFVGIKADTERITVYFPLGFRIFDPDDEDQLREDSRTLFGILSEFMKRERVVLDNTKDIPYRVDFPINAYLNVIRYYMAYGYYSQRENTYVIRPSGNISWKDTFVKQKPVVSGGNMVYTQFVVKTNSRNFGNDLTRINRYCVEESFNKLGWLYLPKKPEQAGSHPDNRAAISILNDALASTDAHKDEVRRLFKSMLDMLKYLEDPNSDKRFYFGVDDFWYIWQEMVKKAFSLKDVSNYFPHGYWYTSYEQGSKPNKSSALQDDSIMVFDGKYYVLDAKFYKYGETGNPKDLPDTDSIQKQITYADFINTKRKNLVDNTDEKHLFNAFIMPFNKVKEAFKTEKNFINVAEAIGDWRNEDPSQMKYYERIQGILVDTRFLMYHYNDGGEDHKRCLAECIEEVLAHPSLK